MTTTTAIIAPTDNQPKGLEQELKFSWRNVFRRWGQNLKDDVDPALTGAKMGLYIHTIPTWHREFQDGKMRSSHGFISGLSALVVGGTELAAYYAGAQMADEQFASLGVPNIGYIAAGATLLATNAVSWGYEAFRRAKKTENSNVIMARIQRATEKPTGDYDLTVEDIARRLGRSEETRREILDTAYAVFNGLVADGQLGKKYEMTANLRTGPEERHERYDSRSGRRAVISNDVAKIILETIKEKGGTANVELFGKMTALYDGERGGIASYHVVPNKKIWK